MVDRSPSKQKCYVRRHTEQIILRLKEICDFPLKIQEEDPFNHSEFTGRFEALYLKNQ